MGVQFTEQAAKKIADVVKRVAGMGQDLQSTPSAPPRPSGDIIRLRVTAVAQDYLTCKQIWADGTTDTVSPVIYALKPQMLRNIQAPTNQYTIINSMTWAGTTQVTVSNGGTPEIWVISPDYKVNASIIYAIDAGETVNIDDHDITLVDLNIDGRCWARTS